MAWTASGNIATLLGTSAGTDATYSTAARRSTSPASTRCPRTGSNYIDASVSTVWHEERGPRGRRLDGPDGRIRTNVPSCDSYRCPFAIRGESESVHTPCASARGTERPRGHRHATCRGRGRESSPLGLLEAVLGAPRTSTGGAIYRRASVRREAGLAIAAAISDLRAGFRPAGPSGAKGQQPPSATVDGPRGRSRRGLRDPGTRRPAAWAGPPPGGR